MTDSEQQAAGTNATTSGVFLPDDVCRRVFVIIPAFNEASRVSDVVGNVVQAYENVIVIDDGSRDETASAAAKAGATVLRHVINRGQGAALQTGIDYALRCGAEFVVTFDSDGQHRVEDIAALVHPIAQGDWEISLGSRFLGDVEDLPNSRRAVLKGGVLFTRLVSRVKITDAHNGLRAFSHKAASKIRITLDRMAHASELIDQIRDSQLPFGEVPVRIRYTDYSIEKGQSSLSAIRILFHYLLKRLTG